MPDKSPSKWVKPWLLGFVFLLLVMIVVGGVTRLTRSGLSIGEWPPVSGIIPPIGPKEWQEQFSLYQQSPEYQQINFKFSLEDYQNIFIWEFFQRLLGRLIFLYSLIPGLIFWKKKALSASLVLLFSGLVAAQGLVGWLIDG